MSDTMQLEQVAADSQSPEPNNQRRLLVVALVGVAVLVVAAAAYFLLLRGGGTEATVVVPTGTAPTAAASASPKPSKLPNTNNNQLGRNPFKPLAAEATPAAAPTSAASPGATTPSNTVSYRYKVAKVDATTKQATVVVNGTSFPNLTTGDSVPPGEAVQIQVGTIGKDSKGSYVELAIGSGSFVKVYNGTTGTFQYGQL